MNKASNRTKNNLIGVHHKLVLAVGYVLAISRIDFFVNEGLRTTERQQEYFRNGTSKLDGIIKKSQHQFGRAIDVYYIGWKKGAEDNQKWVELIEAFKTAGQQLGIKLVFGYDWGWDKPHIQLGKEEK